MGKLADTIRAEMQAKGISFNEAAHRLLKYNMPRTSFYNLLHGTCLPRDTKKIPDIAAALEINEHLLKTQYAYDKTQQLLDELSIEWKDIGSSHRTRQAAANIPLYRIEEITIKLDDKGRPQRKPSTYTAGLPDLGPQAYSIIAPDNRIAPKAEKGDILTFDPAQRKPEENDYALLRSQRGVYIGKVSKDKNGINMITTSPVDVRPVPRNEILFAHVLISVRKVI